MKKIFLTAYLIYACFFSFSPALAYIQVIPQDDPWGDAAKAFGESFGESFANGAKEAQDRAKETQNKLHREEESHELEQRQISLQPTHPSLHLNEKQKELTTKVFDTGQSEICFGYKLIRVFNNQTIGDQVEWGWIVTVKNTKKRRLTEKNAKYYFHLLDQNGFKISSDILITGISIRPGETQVFQGTWYMPYSQITRIADFTIEY
jgi:hypothetical protein